MPRILLDQNTPYGLRSSFPGHEAKTAYELGWAELANGDLIRAAEAKGFDAMVTCDQNIRYQQNMTKRKIALVVLTTNNWDLLKANLDRIRDAIDRVGPGTFEAWISGFRHVAVLGRRTSRFKRQPPWLGMGLGSKRPV